jgi:IS30 family transposase
MDIFTFLYVEKQKPAKIADILERSPSSITRERDKNVYFCHPHSPWEKGTGEHTNYLIRDMLYPLLILTSRHSVMLPE